MCLLKMCLCGFICVCLNDFVFLFFASSIWVKCWQQLPVSLFFYPLIQQEVAVCCSYIVFTGVASVLCTPTGEGWGMQTTTAQHCHFLLHRSPLSLLTGCNLGIKAAFFPCFSTSPKVTLYSWPGYASLGKEERASLAPLHWPKPSLVVGLQWAPPRNVKTKYDMWHHSCTSATQVRSWKTGKEGRDLRMMFGGRTGRHRWETGCHWRIIHPYGNWRWKFSQHGGTVSNCLFSRWPLLLRIWAEDVNLLSAVRLAGRALIPRGTVEFQESGNNQRAKVSNHESGIVFTAAPSEWEPLKLSVLDFYQTQFKNKVFFKSSCT